MKLTDLDTIQKKRNYLEKKLSISLSSIPAENPDTGDVVHCENQIGYTTIPLGVAGPLFITDEEGGKECFIPLATTEGALVASVQRGCKAIFSSGGAYLFVFQKGATRSPVFYTGSISKSRRLNCWIDDNYPILAKLAKETSRHLDLTSVETRMAGPYVYIRFVFDTQEAMGMNMATIASETVSNYIVKQTGFSCLSVAGNFDIDKKPAWLNVIKGRGYEAHAECTIPERVIKKVLKTTSEKLYEVWISKCMVGSALAGSLGFNSHFSNMVAAFFAATGQDLAHVVEGSLGMTFMKKVKNGLYISVMMPSVMLGMVGGGTKMRIKRQAIALTGAKNTCELTGVLAGAVLAGELSLLASLSQGTLGRAHAVLGR